MLSDSQLTEIMPNLSSAKRALYLPFLQQAMEEFEIDTPLRVAAFLAQIAHEAAEFRFMEEIWGPTTAQQRYEPVTKKSQDLGNSEPGDGERFKGRGPIQITGRANYKKYGDGLKIDLLSDPTRAAFPEIGFLTAGLYWKKNGLNELADREWFKTITKRINGGFNGLEDRTKYYVRAKRVLGIATRGAEEDYATDDPADDSGLPLFSRGSEESNDGQ